MKLEQEKATTKNQIEVVEKTKNEIKHIGSTRKVAGLTLFSFNKNTFEIKKAEVKRYAKLTGSGTEYKNEVTYEKDCFYDQALNENNFTKKLIRYGFINKSILIYAKKNNIKLSEVDENYLIWMERKKFAYKDERNVKEITDRNDFYKFLES